MAASFPAPQAPSYFKTLRAALIARLSSSTVKPTVNFYARNENKWTQKSQTDFVACSNGLAKRLGNEGITAGTPVVIVCTSPEATLTAFLAAVLAGALPAILPIRTAFDSAETVTARLTETLSLLGPRSAILMEARAEQSVVEIGRAIDAVSFDPQSLTADFVVDASTDMPGETISHIQLTSGSTGAGKGVAVTNKSLLANIDALRITAEVNENDVFVGWLPLYHDMGLVAQALATFVLGIDVYMLSPFDFLADPMLWIRTISEKQGTISACPTFGYELVTKRATDAELGRLDLSKWKMAFCGAEPVKPEILDSFVSKFAPAQLPPETLAPSYGLAEATLAVTSVAVSDEYRSLEVTRSSLSSLSTIIPATSADSDAVKIVSLGKTVPHVDVFLIDDDGSRITDELICGEIVVKGDSVTAGWVSIDGNLDTFPADGLRTGDIGFFEHNELFVVERIKNVIIRNGQNYSVQTIEWSLTDLLEVDPANVVVLDRDIANGAQLTAVIEIGKKVDPADLMTAISAHAGLFDPPLDSVVFVKRGVLPRTTSGKKRHVVVRDMLNRNTLATLSTFEMTPVIAEAITQEVLAKALEVPETSRSETQLLKLIAESVRSRGLDTPVLLTSNLKYDLDFDSLGLLELAIKVEDTFNVELQREEITKVATAGDLLDVIAAAATSNGSGSGIMAIMKEIKDDIPHSYVIVDDVRGAREVRVKDRWFTDFACCNYLGLETREDIFQEILRFQQHWGLQRWPTRAVAAPRPLIDLEQRLAELVGVPDTMVFPTFTLLHLGVMPSLAGETGAIFIDAKAHKSMHEAAAVARAKGTMVKTLPHGDLAALELALIRSSDYTSRVIAIDGIYSMSGESADIAAYQELAKKYDAFLYIDDAHGFGVVGESPSAEHPFGLRGNGIVKHVGTDYEKIIYVGGLTKAFSTTMAFVSCPTPEYRTLYSASSTAIFGHSVPMAIVAQGLACLNINEAEGEVIRDRLYVLTRRFLDGIAELGLHAETKGPPVITVRIGDIASTITAANVMWEEGVLITPAIFPAAPLDNGGLRFTVNSAHTADQVDFALKSLARVKEVLERRKSQPTPTTGALNNA